MWRREILLTSILTLFFGIADAESRGDAQPADVMVAATQFANDLETVRLFMGKPAVTRDRFQVEFAAPRHDFFQAQTLFRKINRLGVEVAGSTRQSSPPAPEHHSITSDDVLRMVELAQSQLYFIRASLGIESQSPVPERNPRIEAKNVFEVLTRINRQINLMISDPYDSADVFSQLSQGSFYLGGVLVEKGREPFPSVPFVANKEVVDVYELLIDCFVLNQKIGERLDVPVLKINARRLKRNHSAKSDNYDLATILLMDIAFWSAQLEHTYDLVAPAETLKNIFPAHVYMKVESIREQLTQVLDGI